MVLPPTLLFLPPTLSGALVRERMSKLLSTAFGEQKKKWRINMDQFRQDPLLRSITDKRRINVSLISFLALNLTYFRMLTKSLSGGYHNDHIV